MARGVPTLAGGGTYLGWEGGYLPWPREGVLTLARGYLPWLGRYLRGGSPLPRCGRTHTCENITFPHSVGNADGKKKNIRTIEISESIFPLHVINLIFFIFFYRELAFQISEQFQVLGKPMGLKLTVVIGGRGKIILSSVIAYICSLHVRNVAKIWESFY